MYSLETDVCDILVSDNEFINYRNYLVYKSGGLQHLPEGYRIVGNRIRGPVTAIGNRFCLGTTPEYRAREENILKDNVFQLASPAHE